MNGCRSLFPTAVVSILMSAGVAALPPAGGGGVQPHEYHDEMPLMVRTAIELELERSAAELTARGLLPEPRGALTPFSLGWPLRAGPGYGFQNYHGISNFVDLNPSFPNQLLDYTCGTRTYDLTSGYNHAGIDYYLWPYSWRLMDQGHVEIVAVAPGTILAKHDGNDDRSCGSHTGPMWNAVYVQHSDGSVAWYGHMVRNSLTSKPVGATVAAGEYLGLVGSSGFSTGPHLHLELRSSNTGGATIYEPYAGACRAGDSLWTFQREYHDTALNGIAVHDGEPSMAVPCPNPTQEQPRFARIIPTGTRVYLSIYFRDEVPGADVTTLRLYRPNGTLYHQWTKAAPGQFYSGSWWWWWWEFGDVADRIGKWRFEVDFRSQTLVRHFWYGDILFADDFDEIPL